MEGARRDELVSSFGHLLPMFLAQMTVCVKHLQDRTHTLPRDSLTPHLVPQGFSWWRKPAEADFPGAESIGIGVKWCTQAAFWGLGDLAQASHRGDTIHHLCRHKEERTHQC